VCGVGLGLGVTLGVAVGVAVGVALGVMLGVGVGVGGGPPPAQYFPPVFVTLKLKEIAPPQTIISLPVQTAV